MSQLVFLTKYGTVPRNNTEQTMSAFGSANAKYEKKPRCVGGCKETESFVAKSGDTFNKCKCCGNLVHQRLKCGHVNKENATSQSEANNGRTYIRCADPGCRQFLGWASGSGPAASTGSEVATQTFTYATRESVDALTQALTILVGRVAALEAERQGEVGAKRARVQEDKE